jgi:flagellum-specific ATP synthase
MPLTQATGRPGHRLAQAFQRARDTRVLENRGRVVQLIGLVIESEGPLCAVGEVCRIESARHDGSTLAEVVGFRNHHVLLMPLGEVRGIHPGSEVIALGSPLKIPVGSQSHGPRH